MFSEFGIRIRFALSVSLKVRILMKSGPYLTLPTNLHRPRAEMTNNERILWLGIFKTNQLVVFEILKTKSKQMGFS